MMLCRNNGLKTKKISRLISWYPLCPDCHLHLPHLTIGEDQPAGDHPRIQHEWQPSWYQNISQRGKIRERQNFRSEINREEQEPSSCAKLTRRPRGELVCQGLN